MDQLLFGSAYYLEYMPYDRVKEDIRMMKEAGMNVARIAESTWSTLEPEEGIFNFAYVDEMLDAIEEAGLYAIIGTPTYAIPAWLEKKDPTVMVERAEGRKRYGARQQMDIMNTTFRYHAERIIRKLVEHTADRKCVIGFQIDNETKHYGTASENVQKMFAEYLKEKYKTAEAVNKAFYLAYWSNRITDLDDLPDIRGCINGGLSSEFEKFQRSLAADFLKWQRRIVDDYRRNDQFVTHNFDFEWRKFGADIAQDGYSYGIQPDIDHKEAADAVTLSGCDIYHPTQDALTGAEIAFGGDEIRSLKNDNYLVLECQAQAFKYWTPYPKQLRLQAYSHLASGAMGVMYWNWHSIHNGYETYWKGVLSHDLGINPTYLEAGRIGEEFKELGDRIKISKNNRTAILVDNHTLTSYKWFPIDRDLSYNDVFRWIYDSLYEENIECDILHMEELDLSGYDLVITPALYSISEENISKLRSFVEQGGTLVSTFKSFVSDTDLSVYHDSQPHGMTDVFGMSYNQFTDTKDLKVEDTEVRYFAELLKADTATTISKYQHKYWGEYSAVTENIFGKGKAYYIGCYTDKAILKKVLLSAALDAGITVPKEKWPVTIRSGVNPEGRKLHYVLHYSMEDRTIKCPYEKVTELLTGKEYCKGDIIELADWDCLILEE